jgi:uncharacterized protein (DUF885 family)
MRFKNLLAPVSALVAGTVLLSAGEGLAADRSSQAATGKFSSKTVAKPANEAQETFAEMADNHFEAAFRFSPNWATGAGIHTYDDQLATRSEQSIRDRIAELKVLKGQFEGLPKDKLDHFTQLDRELILSNINADLLDLEELENWKKNPDGYSSGASENLFGLIKRDFAPIDERLKSVIAREKLIPELLASGKNNLNNPPKIFTEVALEQMPGTIEFFEKTVPEAVAGAKDQALLAEFKATNAKCIEALKDYHTFLKNDLLPRSKGDFALGKARYRKKLLFEEMVDAPIEVLLVRGEKELKRLQEELVATAQAIDPNKTPLEVMKANSADHPKPAELLDSVKAVLAQLKTASQPIVTIPKGEDLQVEETPPFWRALSFASMDAPGPFEEKAKEAFYNVTLPEKDWPAKKVEEHMQAFSRMDVLNTSVHEAYPGHYVQGLWVRQAPSPARKLIGCSSNSEGWAHYCEEMMVPYVAKGDNKFKLAMLQDALLRCCRYLVGIKMHTQDMTVEQGIAFFEKEGFQEHANAERETKRGTMDPTYCVYTLGKMQIKQLRDDYEKAKGTAFSLKEFHNNFLAQGAPPIKIVREALLGPGAKTDANSMEASQ